VSDLSNDSPVERDRGLVQLVYRSRSKIDGKEYDRLLATCQRNNPKRGITGVLITHAGWFLQVLEGPAEEVSGLVSQIEADPRHSNVLLLRLSSVRSRDFGDWSMASVAVDERRFLDFADHAVNAEGETMSVVRDFLCYGQWHDLAA